MFTMRRCFVAGLILIILTFVILWAVFGDDSRMDFFNFDMNNKMLTGYNGIICMESNKTQSISSLSTNHISNHSQNETELLYRKLMNPQLHLCDNTCIDRDLHNDREPDIHLCFDKIRAPCNVFSFGIKYDFSFDDIMLEKKGCNVWSFDPSMEPAKYQRHKNHVFVPLGIGNIDGVHIGKSSIPTTNIKVVNGILEKVSPQYNVTKLSTLIKIYNISYLDVVRLDVEGGEWEVLQDWIDNDLFQYIGQLLLEIHLYLKPKHHTNYTLDKYAKIINSIPMNVFWAQRNDWDRQRIYKDMTPIYELDFIK